MDRNTGNVMDSSCDFHPGWDNNGNVYPIANNRSGHRLLNRAAEQAKEEVLVIGRLPAGGHLGAKGNGYAIIRESLIPVFSVRAFSVKS